MTPEVLCQLEAIVNEHGIIETMRALAKVCDIKRTKCGALGFSLDAVCWNKLDAVISSCVGRLVILEPPREMPK